MDEQIRIWMFQVQTLVTLVLHPDSAGVETQFPSRTRTIHLRGTEEEYKDTCDRCLYEESDRIIHMGWVPAEQKPQTSRIDIDFMRR